MVEWLVSTLYQSNGFCFDTCKADFAFAIVQHQQCWCSDYAPEDTTDVSACNDPCPGYPLEKCGSLSDGLFGYIALSRHPSGTSSTVSSSFSSSTLTTEATTRSEQSVSSQSLGGASSSFSSLNVVPTFSTMAISSLSLTLFPEPLVSLTTPVSEAHLSQLTILLTSFVQSALSSPEPVTVQETVTASQLVKTSTVSVVCSNPSCELNFLPCCYLLYISFSNPSQACS